MPGERTIEDLFHNLPSPSSDFEQRAKKFRDERNNAWDEFLDLSAQAGYNIKNTLANRSLFMSGYESGKEAMKSQEVEALKRKLAQVRFENWENVGWEDKDD